MLDHFEYDVFLSHNKVDKPRVRQLAEQLKAAGLRVWFDEWSIKYGDDIYLAIERGLEATRVQLLCLSQAALDSEWVELERSTVLFRDPSNKGRRFVPILLENCKLPGVLRRYKYINFCKESEAAFEEILDASRPEVNFMSHQESEPVVEPKLASSPLTESCEAIIVEPPSTQENADLLNKLPSAFFERLVFEFDSNGAVPGREAPQAIRAIELLRIVQATGKNGTFNLKLNEFNGRRL